jgi:RNA polymerase sigma-70 factor, ECF subfamily
MPAGLRVERVVADHQGLVRSFFRRRCASPEDAEDLAQETLCAIVDAFPRFRGEASPSTWVWAICRNVYSRYLYTRRRRERAVAELAARRYGEVAEADDQERREIALLIEGLRPAERLLYECHYRLGLPVKETARLLERPEGTVKYQLHLLRARVREMISPPPPGLTPPPGGPTLRSS